MIPPVFRVLRSREGAGAAETYCCEQAPEIARAFRPPQSFARSTLPVSAALLDSAGAAAFPTCYRYWHMSEGGYAHLVPCGHCETWTPRR